MGFWVSGLGFGACSLKLLAGFNFLLLGSCCLKVVAKGLHEFLMGLELRRGQKVSGSSHQHVFQSSDLGSDTCNEAGFGDFDAAQLG